jgi:hypothetical protein
MSPVGGMTSEGPMTSKYGFVLMMRPMDEDSDGDTFEGFQMVATSYRRQLDDGLVMCIGETNSVYELTVNSPKGNLRPGSPVIDRATGAFSVLSSASPKHGRLERPIATEGEVKSFFVVVEVDPSIVPSEPGAVLPDADPHPEQQRFSPAMATMVTRTGLTGEWAKR